MKVGFFGGTFDPVHNGHLDAARAARTALSLDRICFVPTRQPAHRPQPRASAAHRFAMVALAIDGDETFRVSDLELNAPGPSYTIDTLNRIEAATSEVDRPLFFITGADAFREIRTWRSYVELLDRSHFIVVARPGVRVSSLRGDLPELAPRMLDAPCTIPSTPSIFLVEAPTTDVSATDVRRAVGQAPRSTASIPPAVARYVARHGLYVDRTSGETLHE